MTSFSSKSRSSRPMSPVYDTNHHQLLLIFEKLIPRVDVFHKTANFIRLTQLDGKTFMNLNNTKLADLANNDPLIISRFQALRAAQPHHIQELLGPRRDRAPTAQEETSSREDSHNEDSVVPIIPQSHLDVGPSNANSPDTLNPPPGAASNVEGVHTHISSDAAHSNDNHSSPNRESATFHPDATHPPFGLVPSASDQLGSTSPIDPHTIPLPRSDSDLDLLNVEEDDTHLYDDSSNEGAVGSELATDGLSTNDAISDDESEAWSLVCSEDDENVDEELQAERGSSPFDVIENPPVVPEEPSRNIDLDAAPAHVDVETVSVALSTPVADVNCTPSLGVPDSDGQSKENEVERSPRSHEAGPSLQSPLPAENDRPQHVFPGVGDDVLISLNSSHLALSADVQEATEAQNFTIADESVDAGQSPPPDGNPDPRFAHVSEPSIPGLKEPDQANGISLTDGSSPTCLSNMEENEEASESAVHDLSEPQANSMPAQSYNHVVDAEATPAPLSPPVDPPNSDLDQTTGDDAASPSIPSDPEGQYLKDSEAPSENSEPQQDLPPGIGGDLPTTTNVLEPDLQEAEGSRTTSTFNENHPQSFPPGGLNPSHTAVPTPEQTSDPSILEEHDKVNAVSFTDENRPAGLPNTEEHKPGHFDTVLNEGVSEAVVDNPPEDQTNSKPPMDDLPICLPNLDEANPQRTHFSDIERSLLSLSNRVAHYSSGELGSTADESANSAISTHSDEELDPLFFEESAIHETPTNSAQNGDIPIAHAALSPAKIPIEFDISASTSPSSSSRSVFSDSPLSTRLYPDFHRVSPMSPVINLGESNVLLFCDGHCEDYRAFLTSAPIEFAQILPTSSKIAGLEDINFPVPDDDVPTTNELRLVDHPFDAPNQGGEPASSSNVNSIDLLDEPVPRLLIAVEGETPPAEPPLLDEHNIEVTDLAPGISGSFQDDPLHPASDMNVGQLTDVFDDNQEESMVYNQQIPNEGAFDEPWGGTGDGTLFHVKPSLLLSIDTNIPSLMEDPQLSAFLSPDNNPHSPIAYSSSLMPLPNTSRSSPTSPRSLFPRSECSASERKIESYSKRFVSSCEEREGPRSSFCDVAIQTDSEGLRHLPRLQIENSTMGNVASTLATPLSTVFQWFR